MATETLDPADLRWDDLRFLLAAHRAGTLLGAARALATHASTVGRRLEALERALGAHLFDRTASGLSPTQLAEELVPLAEAMESRAADVLRVVEGRETEPEGWMRLTAPPGIATYVIAPLLPALYERHPGLRVELLPSIEYADLTRREADLAIRGWPPSGGGDLVVTRIVEVTLEPHASWAMAEHAGALRSLDAVPWITWSDALAHLPDAQWIASHVSPERIMLRSATFEPQIEAARAGLGVVMLGRAQGELSGLAPLQLSRSVLPKLAPFPRGSIYLVGHRALRRVPRIAAVWAYILDTVGA